MPALRVCLPGVHKRWKVASAFKKSVFESVFLGYCFLKLASSSRVGNIMNSEPRVLVFCYSYASVKSASVRSAPLNDVEVNTALVKMAPLRELPSKLHRSTIPLLKSAPSNLDSDKKPFYSTTKTRKNRLIKEMKAMLILRAIKMKTFQTECHNG